MPKTTITHEPWCAEHNGDAEGLRETCGTKSVAFGTVMPAQEGDDEEWQRGSLFIDFAEGEQEAGAFLEYAIDGSRSGYGRLDLTALRAVRAALVDDPKGFLIAIDKTLCAIETGVLA